MTKSRCFEINYSVTVTKLPDDARQIEIWTPFPRSTPHQEVLSVDIKSPVTYDIQYDSMYGNAVLHASSDLTDVQSFELVICARVCRQERSTTFPSLLASAPHTPNGASPFRAQLAENRLIRFDPEILDIAERIKIKAKTPLDIGRSAYNHVLEKMAYDKTAEGWGQGDAQFACSIGKGNCTDFHSLFLAIVRACQVPAQFEIGMAFPNGMAEGDITAYKCGYHCWASFYVPGLGWVPVDCSEAAQKPDLRDYYFGNLDENRFLLSYGRDLELPGRTGRQPVNFFTEPVVEADNGVRVDYNKTLAFRNL